MIVDIVDSTSTTINSILILTGTLISKAVLFYILPASQKKARRAEQQLLPFS